MRTDKNFSSATGLRALLGRILQSIIPYRLFHLVGAAWSHLMGPWGPSLLSYLLPGWVEYRQAVSSDFPLNLETLRQFRRGPRNEPDDYLEKLGQWNKVDSLKLRDTFESGLDSLETWKRFGLTPCNLWGMWGLKTGRLSSCDDALVPYKVQAFWDQGFSSSESFSLYKTNSLTVLDIFSDTLSDHAASYQMPHVETGSQLQLPTFDMVPGIPGTDSCAMFTWVTQGKKQNKNIFLDVYTHNESIAEIQPTRDNSLWFLQQNETQKVIRQVLEQHHIVGENLNSLLVGNNVLNLNSMDLFCDSHPKQLVSDVTQRHVLGKQSEFLANPNLYQNKNHKHDHQLPFTEQTLDLVCISQNINPPISEQDQGYQSLENCNCLTLVSSTDQVSEIQTNTTPAIFASPCDSQDHPQIGSELFRPIDGQDSVSGEEITIFARPICTNKYISYILGASSSDEEDLSTCTEEEDWNDDGFDSEGSQLELDIETVDSGIKLWNSFYITDPYNPQNFTAAIHTGAVAEESHKCMLNDELIPSDNDSWCHSDEMSAADSEDECSIDAENLKLWNSFTKSSDLYNPLCFKASVYTAERRPARETPSKHTQVVCQNLQFCELTSSHSYADNPHCLHVRDMHDLPVGDTSAKLLKKKKNGELRPCIDYRGLNKLMSKNADPIPLITELFDRLKGSFIFTKLD
ncbi:protein phosphatase 1 regulatory subunit 15B [Rhinophrynus dorsalis]